MPTSTHSVITSHSDGVPWVLAQEDVEGAQSELLSTVEEKIDSVFAPIADGLGNFVFAEVPIFGTNFPWIVGWLVVAGLIFSIYFGFIQFRAFKLATEVVRGKYTRDDEPGEITHFQALSSALSGTVGLGNIAGVGVAVTIGGAGATFWMILVGLLGMVTKFVECTLGVKYREIHEDGTVSGGPMHYLRKGFAERIPGNAGKILGTGLAGLVAVGILFFGIGGGNMFQANQSMAQLRRVTGGEDSPLTNDGAGLIFGIILAVIVGAVIWGGIKSIGRVTSRLVPSMAIIYIAACAIVILFNIPSVPGAIGEILSGAFTGEGVVGGVIGAIIQGLRRATFSNEAGLGSAPIAHSAVKTKYPATEGLVALLEPFIDTVVVCTMTALTITIASSQYWNESKEALVAADLAGEEAPSIPGVEVTSSAFETALPGFQYVLAVAVLLFAISTMITWAYYGQKAWTFLFGKSNTSENAYRAVFCTFIIVGSVVQFSDVLAFTDAVMFLLALFNVIGLYLLAPVVKRELKHYLGGLRTGEIEEVERV
ncbi:alanine/glycine:cation symporter family protein [Haloechinothrix salitolerans]|uniref:Alanine/glycine:cation symporter family protein n=1 Tax=Haloechinothrix salitolerans TaxID=926830 RepID=A0ABW2BT45_9PSEU